MKRSQYADPLCVYVDGSCRTGHSEGGAGYIVGPQREAMRGSVTVPTGGCNALFRTVQAGDLPVEQVHDDLFAELL